MKSFTSILPNTDPALTLGETVYEFIGHDFGCASEDSIDLGFPCIAVTRSPDGDNPFLVVPLHCLKENSEGVPIEASDLNIHPLHFSEFEVKELQFLTPYLRAAIDTIDRDTIHFNIRLKKLCTLISSKLPPT